MSGEKTRVLDTLVKLFQAVRIELYCMLTKLSDNLIYCSEDTTQALKNWADESWKLATANIALHLELTKKSELNLNDKVLFPQVCIF